MQPLMDHASSVVTRNVAEEIAGAYSDQAVFPSDVVVLCDSLEFPAWSTPVLLLSRENQGVCCWGLSLEGEWAGAVVVGGDLPTGHRTVVYTATVDEFVSVRRWDRRLLQTEPRLQAQASPLDGRSMGRLRVGFEERTTTYGWPCPTNYRFERGSTRVMLWACDDQCDWWIAGPEANLRDLLPDLRLLGDLASSMWSNDPVGEQLLRE